MKILRTVSIVLAWTAVGIAVWAVWPMALKLLTFAQQFHNAWL